MRILPWLAAISILASAGAVGAAEPAAIQAAVRLPSMQLQAGLGYSPRAGLVEVDESGSPEAAIARIRGALKGDASDAPRYRTLGAIYAGQDQHAQSQQAHAKAVELFDAALKERPEDGALAAGRGDAVAGQGDLVGAERFLKAEAKRLPKAWQVRTCLGRVLQRRSLASFWPSKGNPVPDLYAQIQQQGAGFPVLAAIRLKSQFPTAAQFKTANELLTESYAAFEEAVKVAPGEPEVYAERMAHRYSAAPLGGAIGALEKLDANPTLEAIEGALRGVMNSDQAVYIDPDFLADARKVAELRANDPQAWGLVAGMGRLVSRFLAEASKDVSPAVRKALMERFVALNGLAVKAHTELERISISPAPKAAAAGLEALGLIQYQDGDMAAAETTLRKAVSLDPQRNQPWEMLAALLLSRERYADAAALYEGLLKHRDTTKAHLVLAKVYERLQQGEKLEAHLKAALAIDSHDPSTRMYNAAYALRKGGAGAVSAAEQHLAEAEKALPANSGRFEALNVKYVRAAILALQSKPEDARKLLAEVLKEDERHSGALALTEALK